VGQVVRTCRRLVIGIPVLAIMTSLIVSLVQVSGIREDMRQMRAEFHADYRALATDLRADFGALRSEFAALRSDFATLTGKVIEIDSRLTRIEERLEHR
jgi:predicted  nucleic acid-binding Zn-ribbon protein